jgi:hypothetical protein
VTLQNKKLVLFLVLVMFLSLFSLTQADDLQQHSLIEHFDFIWKFLVGISTLLMGILTYLYKKAIDRIEGCELSFKTTATKEDILEIKNNCTTMQANCPKGISLGKIEETLRQVVESNKNILGMVDRIVTRQDELRKDMPEQYILRVEYEKRHESLDRSINSGFSNIYAQLTELTKIVSKLEGSNLNRVKDVF